MPFSSWSRRVVLISGVFLMSACGGGSNPAANDPSGGGNAGSSALLGVWFLERLAPTGDEPVSFTRSDRFTATFEADGRLGLRADCNSCSSRYVVRAGTIEIGPVACTRAYCASAPLDTEFAGLVGAASAWTTEGEKLTLRSRAGIAVLRR
jgi:heat shock protein HslJ